MSKKALVVIILLIAGLSYGGYAFYSTRGKGTAGLKVVSTPAASIFLNDKLIGKTPYEDKHPTGEHTLKLIPEEGTTQAVSWQGKITLFPSVLTYVNRDLGASELTSAGDILFLEKVTGDAQLAVFSKPDTAIVVLDGQEKGTAPLFINDVTPGEHDVAVSSPGFASRTVRVVATSGYKLSVNTQLALVGGSELLEGGTPAAGGETELKKPYVEISDTPTGFLRVRMGPSTSATEAARVKPGEKYPILEEQEDWYKISYQEGKEGWISARYAKKVE